MQVQCSADIFSLSSEGLYFPVPRSADQLGHGSHGAVHTPAPGLEQHHGNQSENSRGQHHTVETERKLCHAGMKQRSVICPMPRQFERPQEGDNLLQSITKNMAKKKIRNPYRKPFDFIHFGMSFFRESPNRPPSRANSCPLPQ